MHTQCDCHGRWRPTTLGWLYIMLAVLAGTFAAHGVRDLVLKSLYGNNYSTILYGTPIEESSPKK
jgi:hypothetical protein